MAPVKRHRDIRDSVVHSKETHATVPESFQRYEQRHDDETVTDMTIKFNTAYTNAKEELPFTKFKPLLDLHRKSGIPVKDIYCNDMKCAEMVSIINDTLKSGLHNDLVESMYYSLIIDAGTDTSVKELEAVNIRYVKNGKPETKLLGVVELEHAHAEGTMDAIKRAFPDDFPDYKEHFIGFCADGASVNFGKKGSVQQKLKDDVPWLIHIWCLPHRLELAVMKMLSESKDASLVMDILHLIYKTYHYSPKSRRELKTIGEELGISVNNPTRVKGTRWTPHTERALKCLLKTPEDPTQAGQYLVIFQHMEHLAASSANADIKGRALNVSKKMKSFEFIAFSHFLLDVLGCIKGLSLTLQSNKTILTTAQNAVKSCIAVIETLAVGPKSNGFLCKFLDMITSQRTLKSVMFSGVEIKGLTDQDCNLSFENMPLTFRHSVEKTVNWVVRGMRDRYDALIGDIDLHDENDARTINCFGIFVHDRWPREMVELMQFGDEQLKVLVDWFGAALERNGCSVKEIFVQWSLMKSLIHHEFQDKSFSGLWEILLSKEPYRSDFVDILHLIKIMLALPVSSAQCERTISAINRIKSDVRNCLDPTTVETLIRISSEGPSVDKFSAKPCIDLWFATARKAKKPCQYTGWPVETHDTA